MHVQTRVKKNTQNSKKKKDYKQDIAKIAKFNNMIL